MTAAAVVTPPPTTEEVPDRTAPRWLQWVFLANLVAQTAIVITGGVVRLTGSGLGCPTWPQCAPGSFTPTSTQPQAWHKYIEFGNRTLTFVLTIAAIASLVGALLWARKLRAAGAAPRRPITWLAAVPLIGTVAQAVLGGVTVLTGLNPAIVASHFLLSSVLIAATLVLYWRSREPGDEPLLRYGVPAVRRLMWALIAVGALVLVMGTAVTGSGPHSGDADTPNRLGLDPAQMSWLHADVVLLFIGLTVGLLVTLHVTDARPAAVRAAWVLLAVELAQGFLGYLQYFTGLPWVIVAVHLAGSAAVWISLLCVPLAMRTRGRTVATVTTGVTAPA